MVKPNASASTWPALRLILTRFGFTPTEVAAGLTTFFTMSYIVVVNPAILSTKGTGMPFAAVLTATVLLAFATTMIMGVYAKLPYALAPGMGLNAFFTFNLVLGRGIPYPVALGLVFWAGVFAVIISILPVREKIIRSIPESLRVASAAGIGLFLVFIGLKNAGLIKASAATLVTSSAVHTDQVLCLVGIVVTLILMLIRTPFAFLGGMAAATIGSLFCGRIETPQSYVSPPDFSLCFKMDILGALKYADFPAVLTLAYTDMMDSISTFVGTARAANMLDKDGNPTNMRRALIADSLATLLSPFFGSSNGTTYAESTAGIEAGGRTGITAIVTALCFLPCLFIAPIAALVPAAATSAVLIVIGGMMFLTILELKVDRHRPEEWLPPFVSTAAMPLMFSITQGILWGFISHVILYVLAGRGREVKPTMYVLGLVSIALVIIDSRAM